tara:strand:+ start:696 stop:860 length:165 start_codon:yes stop_codon:yes gene_type:complete
MKYKNEDKIREDLITQLIEANKQTDRSDNTSMVNTRSSNKIIDGMLKDLDHEKK